MSRLMEKILSRENMTQAYKKVKANKGAGGVDGISLEEIDVYLKENWASIKERILERKYEPQPVLQNHEILSDIVSDANCFLHKWNVTVLPPLPEERNIGNPDFKM